MLCLGQLSTCIGHFPVKAPVKNMSFGGGEFKTDITHARVLGISVNIPTNILSSNVYSIRVQ